MRYDPGRIEPKWQKRWLKDKTYEPNFLRARKPLYNLMMFPYPSAEGLHVGNMYAFVGADIHGRFQRMRGHDVFEPIGLDGFGIHSENYALSIGKHPADQAKISEKRFYKQLEMIGNGFAWRERLETYDPDYYRWTQWIFTEMFRRGLAYRKRSPVNWCPSCKTVLADEQVINGLCERCSSKVIKKEFEQWFFRITAYAERLLKNLEKIDWSERIKIAQRNWIGRSEGSLVDFPIVIASEAKQSRVKPEIAARPLGARNDEFIEVFTTRPDTLFGVTYMVLGPEHFLIEKLESRIKNLEEVKGYIKKAKTKTDEERIAEGREKTGVELKGIKAINPANGQDIPVWVADYVLGNVGTGAIMAVPAHDERDFEFARKYKLKSLIVVCPHYPKTTCPILGQAYKGTGHLVASGKFNGMPSEEAKWAITKVVGGKRVTTYRLRDWLISRQRYWGPPIPMIYCGVCARAGRGEQKEMPGWYVVPGKDLPVKLPYIKNFRPTGTEKSPLATVASFYKVRCPKCKSWARRETDVSDTFLDSAWYYLGYLMAPENWKLKIDNSSFSRMARKWLPVDMYIGGAEHAVLHLLYVRFLAMVFFDWGLTHFEEPFKKFRAHGLLIKDGAKMSKSRGNVVNPDDYIRAYGADALRMYLMFLGPFEQGGDFRDTSIRGVTRFLERVWRFARNVILRVQPEGSREILRRAQNDGSEMQKLVHRTIKKITDDIEGLRYNTAIAALMVLLNNFEENPGAVTRENIALFLRLLAPFAPFITEELWSRFFASKKSGIRDSQGESGHPKCLSIHRSRWPEADARYLKTGKQTLVIQVNGKVRDRVEMEADARETEVKEVVLAREKVRQWVGSKPVRKFVYVPGRIVNVVIS